MPPPVKKQTTLFDLGEPQEEWEKEWLDMPEFVSEDQKSYKCVLVHFKDKADMEKFATLINQTLTMKTRSVWYPRAEIGTIADKRYADQETGDKK